MVIRKIYIYIFQRSQGHTCVRSHTHAHTHVYGRFMKQKHPFSIFCYYQLMAMVLIHSPSLF